MNINEDIGKISKLLMYKEAFYGLFLISLNKEVSERIETAGVSKNGINCQLTINPKFWNSLTNPHKEGLLKHELLHIAFQHLSMRDKYSDKKLFNVAADLEINQYINAENLPEGALTLANYSDLNLPKRAGTRVYYELLDKAQQKNPKLKEQIQGIGPEDHPGHSTWSEFEEGTEAEKDLIKRQIDHQLKEVYSNLKSRGLVPGEMESYIKDLFEQKVAVFNWKAYLRRFINGSNKYFTKKTRRKLNKRFYGFPAIKIIPKSRILVAIDTSGSVSNAELLDFFSEIYHVWKTGCSVDIVECDAKLYPAYEYKGKFTEKVNGRGGTSFQPVIDFYNENSKKYNTCIYFTDGECSAPSKPKGSIMWVISSNASEKAVVEQSNLPGFKILIPKAT